MLQGIFKLKYPVSVKLKNKLKWGNKKIPCEGIYEWDSEKKVHVILVSRKADIRDVTAHEYIHAWQCEMGLKLSHGRVFKWWAEYLYRVGGYKVSEYQ